MPEGLKRLDCSPRHTADGTIPQAASRPAPFTQGSQYSTTYREFWAPEGAIGEKQKSVKNRAALLHGLAFLLLDLLFGVLRGERLAAKTMAASLLRKPARAVIRPAGANIARSPVSLRSTVAPCSQPRNPLGRAPRLGTSGTFLLLFWSQKSRHNGNRQLKKALPQGRQGR